MRHYDVEVPDNLRARRARTQIQVLGRAVIVTIVGLALVSMLLTFPEARAVGTSLLASAGIVGVSVGAAARSTLGNLIAGRRSLGADPPRRRRGGGGRVGQHRGDHPHLCGGADLGRRRGAAVQLLRRAPDRDWTRYSADIVVLHSTSTTPPRSRRSAPSSNRCWRRPSCGTGRRRCAGRGHHRADHGAARPGERRQRTHGLDLRCEVRERLLAWLSNNAPGRCRGSAPSWRPGAQNSRRGHPSGRDRAAPVRAGWCACGRPAGLRAWEGCHTPRPSNGRWGTSAIAALVCSPPMTCPGAN